MVMRTNINAQPDEDIIIIVIVVVVFVVVRGSRKREH